MICEDWQDFGRFGRGFVRICETLGEDSHGFTKLWKRVHKDLQDLGGGFVRHCERICETLGEDY